MDQKLLSLCIPTNGVIEWVLPVLDSIYEQRTSESLFEIIITDNGTNDKFKEAIKKYQINHTNINYQRTNAKLFLNQIEAFKLSSGKLIKFINHRMKFLPGSMDILLDIAKNENESIIYFTNGKLKRNDVLRLGDFDTFVNCLGILSSWSAGISMWKTDFDNLKSIEYNFYFPHIDLLFAYKERKSYLIDDRAIMVEMPVEEHKRGKYNYFQAFAVAYPSLILDLYLSGDIKIETFENIRINTLYFLVDSYYLFLIQKKQSSYDFTDYKKNLSVFFKNEFGVEILKAIPRKSFSFLKRLIKR